VRALDLGVGAETRSSFLRLVVANSVLGDLDERSIANALTEGRAASVFLYRLRGSVIAKVNLHAQ
jgi:hypothetical protein